LKSGVLTTVFFCQKDAVARIRSQD